jgi:hypothetical protein
MNRRSSPTRTTRRCITWLLSSYSPAREHEISYRCSKMDDYIVWDFRVRKIINFIYLLCIVYCRRLFSNSDYLTPNETISERWIGKSEKKRCLPNLKYCLRVWLEGLRKSSENLSQDCRSEGRYLNSRLLEYKAEMLTTQPRRRWNRRREK